MRVALFTNNYLPFRGGVTTAVETLHRGLERLRHRAWVFAPASRPAVTDPPWVFRYPSIPAPTYPGFALALPFSRRLHGTARARSARWRVALPLRRPARPREERGSDHRRLRVRRRRDLGRPPLAGRPGRPRDRRAATRRREPGARADLVSRRPGPGHASPLLPRGRPVPLRLGDGDARAGVGGGPRLRAARRGRARLGGGRGGTRRRDRAPDQGRGARVRRRRYRPAPGPGAARADGPGGESGGRAAFLGSAPGGGHGRPLWAAAAGVSHGRRGPEAEDRLPARLGSGGHRARPPRAVRDRPEGEDAAQGPGLVPGSALRAPRPDQPG